MFEPNDVVYEDGITCVASLRSKKPVRVIQTSRVYLPFRYALFHGLDMFAMRTQIKPVSINACMHWATFGKITVSDVQKEANFTLYTYT